MPSTTSSLTQQVQQLIADYPLATLISMDTGQCTPLPLLYETDSRWPLGRLAGHSDRRNPHTETLLREGEVHALFTGESRYISPTRYPSMRLPSWHYEQVQLRGKVHALRTQDDLRHLLMRTTRFLERHNNPPFTLSENHDYMNRLLDHIFGFYIEIRHWEARIKHPVKT